MPKTQEAKDNEIMNRTATEPWSVHRLFLEETARWRPGGYVDRDRTTEQSPASAKRPAAPSSGQTT